MCRTSHWWTGLLYGATLIWTVPEYRGDGTVLPPDQISHYEIYLDEKFRAETTKTKYRAYRHGHYRVRAVLIDGVDGYFSNLVYVGPDADAIEDDFSVPAEAVELDIE